jgi:NAD(P)-dependent dehydrogenase (short-subunit alcohol dehydrogenase family)
VSIRVNAVAPAGVKTPMRRTMPFFQAYDSAWVGGRSVSGALRAESRGALCGSRAACSRASAVRPGPAAWAEGGCVRSSA